MLDEEKKACDIRTVSRKRRRVIIALAVVLALVFVCVAACVIYISDYYRADTAAMEGFSKDYINVTVAEFESGLVISGEYTDTGLIFYTGGKVEYTAYTPLMQALAERGVMCVLLKMPFNLAVLDMNAADGIRESYPDIEHWYMGGHSLGGTMAAGYLLSNPDGFDGLILLGSYSTADLSDSGKRVLSLYGSEDKVINREKYDECKKNLPDGFTEYEIDGGCHAYFGMYGEQSGDGIPKLSVQEQIELSAMIVSSFAEGN